ncbi:hypothetical protein HYU07_06425 [Candidatus Woesearchaeota archaeon]|nr:hypothetical protein [Candidatus Woesearchaeota archaeon]
MKPYQISNKDTRTLNRIVDSSNFKSPEAVLKHLIKNYAHELIQPQNITIDLQSAVNGAYKTQKDWIALYNAQEGEFKGKRMISASDIYQAGKTASDEVLGSLRKDFDESWEVSSTRIRYNPNDLGAKIVHNFGSTVVQPTKINISVIPVYQDTPLPRILNEEDGVTYFQSVLNTTDNPKTITEVLEHLSKRRAGDIRDWTPDQSSRNSNPERAVGFDDFGGWFLVDGNYRFDGSFGRSRGVLISPRSGRAKK